MCLAIFAEQISTVPQEHLENAADNNPDGCGFAVATPNGIVVRKGVWDTAKLLQKLQPFQDYPGLIHFRLATHGKINKRNCHPWRVSDRIACIHNGILKHRSSDELSDTGHFVQDVLRPLATEGHLLSAPVLDVLEKHIGTGNKIVLMDDSGTPFFLNEKSGHWDEGVWYSNDSYAYSWTDWYAPTKNRCSDVPLCWECDGCMNWIEDRESYDWEGWYLCRDCFEENAGFQPTAFDRVKG